MVQPIFEKISYCQKMADIKDQIKVSAKTLVNSQEVTSVLSLSPFVTIEQSEKLDGTMKYCGKITFYVCYLDKEGLVQKSECGSEFRGEIKDQCIKDNSIIRLTALVEKAGSEIDGTSLSATAYVGINASVENQFEETALSGGENLYIQEQEIEICNGLGVRKGAYPIEEQFELSYSVEQVMHHSAQAVITAVQSGVGCIIVDGSVLLSLVLLQKSEKKDIIKVCKNLPFRMEIECEEAMPNMRSVARVREKSIKTDIEVDNENSLSFVNVSVNLDFEGQAFINQTVMLANDVFSTKYQLETSVSECQNLTPLDCVNINFNLTGKCLTDQLPLSLRIMAVCDEKATILSHSLSDCKMTVTGVYTATAYFIDGEDNVFCRAIEMPFEKILDPDFDLDKEYELEIKAFRGQAKIVSATELEVESQIYLSCYPMQRSQFRFIKSVQTGEQIKCNDSAISVYIACGGEQLFKLAKRLNVCPNELIKNNSDLQFPLSGNEKIVIYRQKQ